MTTESDSGKAADQTDEPASPPHAITYEQAQTGYRCTIDARQRFEELANRDLSVRAFAVLKARGTYDPRKHGDVGKFQPLTAAEHLEILAAGEMLARYYRHPALVHQAVVAGASWSQVAAATGTDEATAQQGYREWADGQHRLYADYEGKFGMDAAEHSAAISRAADPPAGSEIEQEAGQRPARRRTRAARFTPFHFSQPYRRARRYSVIRHRPGSAPGRTRGRPWRAAAGRQGGRDHLDPRPHLARRPHTRTAGPARRITAMPRMRRQTPHHPGQAKGRHRHETATKPQPSTHTRDQATRLRGRGLGQPAAQRQDPALRRRSSRPRRGGAEP